MKEFRCVICGKETKEYGNNPWPVKEKGECCSDCNLSKVIPARVVLSNQDKRK